MNALEVSVEVGGAGEALGANVAGEGLLARVAVHVDLILRPVGERFAAELTDKSAAALKQSQNG